MTAVRQWYIGRALSSVNQLNAVLTELTEAEVFACLALEADTRRRKSVLRRLIGRAVRLNELTYAAQLHEQYL
jgi:hypothetical protein